MNSFFLLMLFCLGCLITTTTPIMVRQNVMVERRKPVRFLGIDTIETNVFRSKHIDAIQAHLNQARVVMATAENNTVTHSLNDLLDNMRAVSVLEKSMTAVTAQYADIKQMSMKLSSFKNHMRRGLPVHTTLFPLSSPWPKTDKHCDTALVRGDYLYYVTMDGIYRALLANGVPTDLRRVHTMTPFAGFRVGCALLGSDIVVVGQDNTNLHVFNIDSGIVQDITLALTASSFVPLLIVFDGKLHMHNYGMNTKALYRFDSLPSAPILVGSFAQAANLGRLIVNKDRLYVLSGGTESPHYHAFYDGNSITTIPTNVSANWYGWTFENMYDQRFSCGGSLNVNYDTPQFQTIHCHGIDMANDDVSPVGYLKQVHQVVPEFGQAVAQHGDDVYLINGRLVNPNIVALQQIRRIAHLGLHPIQPP